MEDAGEVICLLLFNVGLVGLLVGPSGCLHNVRLLGEGLPLGLLKAFPSLYFCKDVLWALHQCWLPHLHPASALLGWVCLCPRNSTTISTCLWCWSPHSWVVANIPRMVAKGTLPVRICKGTGVLYGTQADRLAWPPQRLGDPVPWPLLPHILMPAYFPGGPAEECRPCSGSTAWPLWWPWWPGHHSGMPQVLHLAPALCLRNLWWPCLWVIAPGPCSFSPAAKGAHLRNWQVHL